MSEHGAPAIGVIDYDTAGGEFSYKQDGTEASAAHCPHGNYDEIASESGNLHNAAISGGGGGGRI